MKLQSLLKNWDLVQRIFYSCVDSPRSKRQQDSKYDSWAADGVVNVFFAFLRSRVS